MPRRNRIKLFIIESLVVEGCEELLWNSNLNAETFTDL